LPSQNEGLPMNTPNSLLGFHERAHSNLVALLDHCGGLSQTELHCELPGFGYPTIQLQLHHMVGAEKYWVGVLQGRIDVDEDAPDYPTVGSLVAYRKKVFEATELYLRNSSEKELNSPRSMTTWGDREKVLVPAHVIIRTQAHLYHHQGQITAMCRLQGHPINGLDYPLT
jgi:uncharacterized damage-inducible protein DinB